MGITPPPKITFRAKFKSIIAGILSFEVNEDDVADAVEYFRPVDYLVDAEPSAPKQRKD